MKIAPADDALLFVDPDRLPETLADLRDTRGFDRLECLTAVDLKDHLETVYVLYSWAKAQWLTVKARLDRARPTVPSATGVFPGAEFEEREVYDLMGIVFTGHPDLRRILLPDDFNGHPLRKDWRPDQPAERRAPFVPQCEPSAPPPSRTETYTLNMGPQHPSTHGVLRVQMTLDGERIVRVRPIMGYLHRGIEKLMESRTYVQCAPFTDRLDYISSMNNNYGYARAVEELMGIEVPRRAEYIRVVMAELSRIASHLIFIGSLSNDLGATTGMIYTFRDRERILDLFDYVCGARQTCHYIRIGGVSADIQPDFAKRTFAFLATLKGFMAEYDDLLTGNEIFKSRLVGVSKLTAAQALSHNLTGPNLRAVGVPFDVRKADAYGAYPDFEFNVVTRGDGDNWARYMARYFEVFESARIIRQALEGMPRGEFMAKVPRVLKPPAGEVFSRTEGTRGELGFYIVSDGTAKPYRVHVRRPSFVNMQALNDMCAGHLIGDSVAAYSAIDPIMGEVDC